MPTYKHQVRTAGPFIVITCQKTEIHRYINPQAVTSFEKRNDDTLILSLNNGEVVQLHKVELNDLFHRITEARRFA